MLMLPTAAYSQEATATLAGVVKDNGQHRA
jgi:hypothetical protein